MVEVSEPCEATAGVTATVSCGSPVSFFFRFFPDGFCAESRQMGAKSYPETIGFPWLYK